MKVDFGDDLDFLLFLAEQKPGNRLSFGVLREGRPLTIVVTLGALPDSARAGYERSLDRARAKRQRKQAASQ